MDCRYPEHRDVNLARRPWHLGSGIPCRNDEFFLNLMAVTLCVGMPPATLQRRKYRTAGAVKAAFPRGSVTTIKLAAHRDVGVGFSLRPDTHRSLKAAPTGLNLMAVTLRVGMPPQTLCVRLFV